MDKYLPDQYQDTASLPGLGGIYNSRNLSLYQYAAQNPVKYRDPDGNVLIFGAIVGAALDTGLQLAMIAAGEQTTGFSVTSVFISAAAGATGAGLALKVGQAVNFGNKARIGLEVAADAAVSTGSNVAKSISEGKDLNAVDIGVSVVADVIAGQTLGKKFSESLRSKAETSDTNKILNRQADRLERISRSPEASRPEAKARNAGAARSVQQDFVTREGVKGGVVGSGLASTVTSGVIDVLGDD